MSEPVVEFNGDFSEPGAEAVPWAEAAEVLAKSEMFWLSTVRRDGRPHVTPLPTVFLDGTLYFCAGEREQKAVNLWTNAHCVLTTGTNQLHSGLDVIVEGEAVRVTNHDTLVRLAALWKSKLDWDYSVAEDHFGDPAGRTGLVFGVTPVKVLSFGKGPYSQTRYRFSRG
jgi:general stress protein 26